MAARKSTQSKRAFDNVLLTPGRPDDIKNNDSFNRFKKGLKLYIQNQPYKEE